MLTLSLDALTGTVAASAEHSAPWLRHVTRARLAELIGRPMSYIAGASAIEESGLTTEDIPGVMIAVTDAELASQIESSNSGPAGAG